MRFAVVTGGTSGIVHGAWRCLVLVSKGYHVFTTYVGHEFTEKIDNYEAHHEDLTKREV